MANTSLSYYVHCKSRNRTDMNNQISIDKLDLNVDEKFDHYFGAFSKFGSPKSDGTQISLTQSDRWLKQARIIDGTNITTTDSGILFKKLSAYRMSKRDYIKFLKGLAAEKKLDYERLKVKMILCGSPATSPMWSISGKPSDEKYPRQIR